MTHIYHQLPRRHKQLLLAVSVVTAILFMLPSDDAQASRSDDKDTTLKVAQRYEVAINGDKKSLVAVNKPQAITENSTQQLTLTKTTPVKEPATESESTAISQQQVNTIVEETKVPALQWQSVKVKSGDSLALIFDRAGFSPRTLHNITTVGKATKALKKIMPGQIIKFGADNDGRLQELRYQQDIVTTLVITAAENGFDATTEKRELETREKLASAVIDSNFWNAGISAGLEPNVIMNLANIFGWDIDFGLDIRKGDHFNIIYETKFLDGEEVKTGQIIAAEFVNQGESYQAIRHTDGEYYSASGRSMRKAFLRAPVNFKYISSNFNPRRLHPVTKTIKAHNGIDYAARRGTPVMASGSGTVSASGYSKYNGNYVFIKHGEKYLTKYLHLHKRSVSKGQRVKQGQKIGTVGATGRVTGVHLHYEFLVNGVHRNPRTVKLPKSQPIAKKEKAAFLAIAEKRMAQLETNKRIMLASNQDN
ncbi:MAG: peptidoglycan DD-metalloendopeptidase family protein [Psychrobium sp.]